MRRILSLIAVVMLTVGLAACGSTAESSKATPANNDAKGDVVAKDFKWTTKAAGVKAGAVVKVVNDDTETQATHSVVSDEGFKTDNIAPGKSDTFTAPTKPGEYKFKCGIHSFMEGTLKVI